ncbi:hypothetical protein K469DRAFT_700035 [Zopfia rhizophila CBS 207.26]|uniref:Protein SQS1 n=1 Tax=Zopfia rhizophila CBS 207.26 TaxID=1314779 RepID=A0A6A6D9X0_9PEZI|nr:hypothetical protein K469DRAFT_700035 [Zopfia rhizophila CBS 207.26]
MARRKKGKGSVKASPRQPPFNRRNLTPSAPAKHFFSLKDEARFTSQHHTLAFSPGRKLRNLKVNFISAGLLEGTIKKPDAPASPVPPSTMPPSPTNSSSLAMAQLTIRSSSPSSDSSEEVVVFKGRGVTPQTQPTTTTPSSSDESSSPPAQPTPSASGESKVQSQVYAPTLVSRSDSGNESVIPDVFQKRLGGMSKWEMNTTPWVSRSKPGIGWLPVADRPPMGAFLHNQVTGASAIDDYMQNVREFQTADGQPTQGQPSFAHRDIDINFGADNDWVSETHKSPRADQAGWDSDDLRDLDGISTSSDVIEKIERILAARTRKTGLQYLIVYEGSTADDARWLPASFLTTENDLQLIKEFEMENMSHGRRRGSDTDSDSTASISDEGDIDDDDNFYIDDERLAKILAKQEEFGLGSDEVVLFGGDEIFDGPASAGGPARIGRPSKRQQQQAKGTSKRSEMSFPSASLMADVLEMDPYNGFDVMDTGRPSLRPLKKGRRGQPPQELSDSDLNEKLQAAWEADRSKKRIKKAEREDLRRQGLLGRKDKGPKLSVKYKDGFTMADVVEEIREFMASPMQTLSLPPMDANRRAVVHQFVHALGLSSRSRGDGYDRFTVLSKASSTMQFDHDTFDCIVEQNKFKYRLQGPLRGGGPGKGPKAHAGNPKSRPVVSYKDGDKVGASAPELGPENRGHAMMAKMGWKKGEALGHVDNKGILQPIAHTVKINRAGLQ